MFIICLQKKYKKILQNPLTNLRKCGIIYTEQRKARSPKERQKERLKQMMITVATSEAWFNEIYESGRVEMRDFFFYEENGRKYVEYDVNEEQFNEVSAELGWM